MCISLIFPNQGIFLIQVGLCHQYSIRLLSGLLKL
nr:MAG TPA: hypothetical protein [Bacteriophage sp.]DAM50531.1 MAG TPA: hypothetical protein [Caudoviricetes sp.]